MKKGAFIFLTIFFKNLKATSDDHHWMMTSIEEFQEMVFNVINTQSLVTDYQEILLILIIL